MLCRRSARGGKLNKIAIISDIHGNTTALKAVLKSIKEYGISNIICLGDLVGKGPQPSEAVDICRRECAVVIKGNWDDIIANRNDDDYELSWHRNELSEEQKEYLRKLPETYSFLFGNKAIRLFHSSSSGIHKRVHMYDTFENHNQMFENTPFTGNTSKPDVIGYGDIHDAYIKYFRNRILFNTGSVGNPLDLNQASYVVIEEQEWESKEKTLDFIFRQYEVTPRI
jgi:protein phosphatase